VNDLINRWFGRAARLEGALAYGLRYSDARTFSQTWESRLSEAVLNELWNRLAPMAAIAAADVFAENLRWAFNGALVVGAARSDGLIFFVLTPKKANEVDEAGLQRLLHEFRALRA
jgi:hypothetical protein